LPGITSINVSIIPPAPPPAGEQLLLADPPAPPPATINACTVYMFGGQRHIVSDVPPLNISTLGSLLTLSISGIHAVPLYHSTIFKLVLKYLSPITGLPGLLAVSPCGILKNPVSIIPVPCKSAIVM
jgi:hypothetical protein